MKASANLNNAETVLKCVTATISTLCCYGEYNGININKTVYSSRKLK